jgi:hypothetical protein
LKREIRRGDKEVNSAKKELKYWIDFKNKGTFDLQFQKELLEKEISYMKENYEIISSKFWWMHDFVKIIRKRQSSRDIISMNQCFQRLNKI